MRLNRLIILFTIVTAASAITACGKKNLKVATIDHLEGIKNETWELLGETKSEMVKAYNAAMEAAREQTKDAAEKLTKASEDIQARLAKQREKLDDEIQEEKKEARKELIKGLEKMQEAIKKEKEALKSKS